MWLFVVLIVFVFILLVNGWQVLSLVYYKLDILVYVCVQCFFFFLDYVMEYFMGLFLKI